MSGRIPQVRAASGLCQGTTSGVTAAGNVVANFAIEFFLIAVHS